MSVAAPVTLHKRRAGSDGAICRRRLIGEDAGHLIDASEATTDYWESVTCSACLGMKPDDAPGRTSVKHSHRVEGFNFID